MPSADLFNSLIAPVLLLALLGFLARRSLLWMLGEIYRAVRHLHMVTLAKLQLRMLLLERYIAHKGWRERG